MKRSEQVAFRKVQLTLGYAIQKIYSKIFGSAWIKPLVPKASSLRGDFSASTLTNGIAACTHKKEIGYCL
jgi:hypothetical protein